MRWIKYWISGFGGAMIVLCVGIAQRDSGFILAAAAASLLGTVGLVADLKVAPEVTA